MLEASWMWVRTLGSLCALGCLLSVACSDSEGNGVTGGSGGGGTGGSDNGGGGTSGSGNGGSGNGGTSSDDAGVSECRCGGRLECPNTLAELCADLPEGCPARLETWLTCGERGLLVEREGVGALYLRQCDQYRVVHRQANYIGARRWIYDEQGRLVAVEDVDDTNIGPRCGVNVPADCRFRDQGEPLARQNVPDAGSDAGSSGDGGAPDSGVADSGVTDGGALECERL